MYFSHLEVACTEFFSFFLFPLLNIVTLHAPGLLPVAAQPGHWLRGGESATQWKWDRISHEKVIRALRKAGGVQFMRVQPESARIIYCEAAKWGNVIQS